MTRPKIVEEDPMARRPMFLVPTLATLLLVLGGTSTGAQSTEPAHPAHIHTGTCAEPGDVVAPLSDVTVLDPDQPRIETSITSVDLKLDDIVASPHLIMAHKSTDEIGVFIACADLTGPVADKRLSVALGTLNDSGHVGVAFLLDESGGTDVYLSLTAPEGTQAAPAVTIEDFDFSPPTLDVGAGVGVTWTNKGNSGHTVTADDGSFTSSTIQPGASFTQAFTQPGTYAYHCAIHPSMTGTITVS
jgi:plastocyanin